MNKQNDLATVTLQVPRDVWERTQGKATQDGVKVEDVVVEALRAYLGLPKPIQQAIHYNLPRQRRKT